VVVNSPLPISLIPDTKEETATKEVLCNVWNCVLLSSRTFYEEIISQAGQITCSRRLLIKLNILSPRIFNNFLLLKEESKYCFILMKKVSWLIKVNRMPRKCRSKMK
jgi:hypothetical protein